MMAWRRMRSIAVRVSRDVAWACVVLSLLAACTAPFAPVPTFEFRDSAVCDKDDEYSVGLTWSHDMPLAPVTVNGATLFLLVDSGADRSEMTEQGLRKLGLSEGDGHVVRTAINQSDVRVGFTYQRDVSIGGLVVRHVEFEHYPSLRWNTHGIDGTLGLSFFRHVATQFDLRDRRLIFYSPACDPVARMDRSAWRAVPIVAGSDRLVVAAKIDGKPLIGTIDTGSNMTFISRSAAAKLGVDVDSLSRGEQQHSLVTTVSTTSIIVHRFTEMTVGPVIVRNPNIGIILDNAFFNFLIGRNLLNQVAFFTSPKQREIFLRYDQLKRSAGSVPGDWFPAPRAIAG